MSASSWQNGIEKLPTFRPDFQLNPRRSALVVVDMQYGDAHPDYGLGPFLRKEYPETFQYRFSRISEIVLPNLIRLLDFFRANGLRVIYLTVGPHLADSSDLIWLWRKAMGDTRIMGARGTSNHAILPEIAPREGDLVINKTSQSAFTSSGLDQTLRNLGVEGLVFTGVSTHNCVGLTSRDAADRGYLCVVVEDACAGISQQLHDEALRIFYVNHGPVQTTAEVLVAFQQTLDASQEGSGTS